ncbi:MAG: hypothetical protein KBG15_13080, partial [Kofleriaceae bacterium]|nr:hypothetical protein [Kofleriaceae bacterium]
AVVIGFAAVRTASVTKLLSASAQLRSRQRLRLLMIFFVVAHLVACGVVTVASGAYLALMTGTVFLGGAFFVFSVVRLGEVSMRDLEVQRKTAIEHGDELEVVLNREQATRKQIEDSNRRLESSNKELEQFAYVASHDLQEPLRKVKAFGQLLVDETGPKLDENSRMYIDRMQKAAMRMSSLIEDLLSYSRASRGEEPYVNVDMQKLTTEVLGDLETRIQETGAQVRFEKLPRMRVRATQMRQLVQNLLGNALKFRKSDVAPIVTVTASRLPDDAIGAPGWALEISDNGVGFEPQYSDQIFGIFQRLHGRSEYEGTGVGLAIVLKIAEGHGGTIRAVGRPGQGATFIANFPDKPRGDQS